MTTLTRCTSCRAALRADERGRQGCLSCQEIVYRGLRDLCGRTGLYAALSEALSPSRSGADGPRTSGGAAEPSLGVDSRVLDLMSPTTGVHAVLSAWAADWCRLIGRQMIDPRFNSLCRGLAHHLGWAVYHHPAWADFHTEICHQVALCRQAIGEAPPRRQTVGTCHTVLADHTQCGGELHYQPDTITTRCRACHTAAPVDWRAIRAAVTGTAV